MRRAHALFVATAISTITATTAITACDSEDGRGDGEGSKRYCERPDGPYEGMEAVFAEYCAAIERCELGVPNGFAFACRQECVQAFSFGMTCGIAEEDDRSPFDRRIEKREVTFDAAHGTRCANWLKDAACTDIGAILANGNLFDDDDSTDTTGAERPCDQVVEVIEPSHPPQNSLPAGSVCDDSYDCAGGLYCAEHDPAGDVVVCMSCTSLPAPGSPCRDYQCAAGAYCDTNAAEPYLCAASKSAGANCTNGQECASELCFESSCIDPKADGATCTSAQECTSRLCFEDHCLTPLEAGQSCTADAQCATYRCFRQQCIALGQTGTPCEEHAQCYGTCYQGQCAEQKRQGESCDEDANCFNQRCYEHVCTPPDALPEGAPCTTGYECLSDRCVDSHCVNPRENGQPCTAPEGCAWNICVDGLCGLPDGTDCDYREQCRSGRCPNYTNCAQPLADGAMCIYSDECESFTCLDGRCFTLGMDQAPCTRREECESGYFCDPETSVCTNPRGNGEHCTIDDACLHHLCDPASSLCGLANGSTCANDDQCQGFCDATTCASPLAEGSNCERDLQCLGYCVFGRCSSLKPFFTICNNDAECEGGICDYYNSTFHCRGVGQCFEHEHCAMGEYCNEDNWPYVCVAKKPDGETCDEDAECANYCSYRCVAKRPFDAACVADEECVGGFCENNRCSEPGHCYSDSNCPQGQVCEYSGTRGRCIDKKADGLSCDGDEQCASGFCSNADDTCKTHPKRGEACMPFECTLDSYCVNGTCQARKFPGSACDDGYFGDLECLAPSFCRHGRCENLPLECEPAHAGSICTLLMGCANDAYCDLLDDFTCKARFKNGEACETVLWRANTCLDGSTCNQVCRPYAAIGSSCGEAGCDPRTSYCDAASTTCHALKYQGELCTEREECLGEDCNYISSEERRCGGPCKPF